MDDVLRCFLDESKKPVRDPKTGKVSPRGEHYVVAGAIMLHGDVNAIRNELRELATGLGVALHYNDLSRKRRLLAVERIASLDHWDGYLFETAQPLKTRHNTERRLRAKTMGAAFKTLGADGTVTELVLETRSKPSAGFVELDDRDHRLLQSLRAKNEVPSTLAIRHDTKDEPLLWLADVLAGARTDHLCDVHKDIYPRIAHRVLEVHQVLKP